MKKTPQRTKAKAKLPEVKEAQLLRVIEELAAGFTVSSALLRANIKYINAHQRLNELKEQYPWFAKEIPARAEEAARERVISQDAVLGEIAAIGFADIADYHDPDGKPLPLSKIPPHARRAMKRIRSETDEKGKTRITEIELLPKMDALTQMGRYFSMFTDKVDHTGELQVKDMSDVSIIKRLVDLCRKGGVDPTSLGIGAPVGDAQVVHDVPAGGAVAPGAVPQASGVLPAGGNP